MHTVDQQALCYSSRAEAAECAGGVFQPMHLYLSTVADAKRRSSPIVLLHSTAMFSEISPLVTTGDNLVEYLTACGFDVYMPELGMSTAVAEVVSTQNGTVDLDTIATHDLPSAVADVCVRFAERHQLNVDD